MKNLNILFLMTLLLTGMMGCEGEEEKARNYPAEVPFTEFSLAETSCQWKNFEPNKVIVINSNDELKDYIVCAEEEYSQIDFLENSLLLARGGSTSGIENIDISLSQEISNKYALDVAIHTNATTVARPWLVSIITPKIANGSTVTLNVQQIK